MKVLPVLRLEQNIKFETEQFPSISEESLLNRNENSIISSVKNLDKFLEKDSAIRYTNKEYAWILRSNGINISDDELLNALSTGISPESFKGNENKISNIIQAKFTFIKPIIDYLNNCVKEKKKSSEHYVLTSAEKLAVEFSSTINSLSDNSKEQIRIIQSIFAMEEYSQSVARVELEDFKTNMNGKSDFSALESLALTNSIRKNLFDDNDLRPRTEKFLSNVREVLDYDANLSNFKNILLDSINNISETNQQSSQLRNTFIAELFLLSQNDGEAKSLLEKIYRLNEVNSDNTEIYPENMILHGLYDRLLNNQSRYSDNKVATENFNQDEFFKFYEYLLSKKGKTGSERIEEILSQFESYLVSNNDKPNKRVERKILSQILNLENSTKYTGNNPNMVVNSIPNNQEIKIPIIPTNSVPAI